MLLLRSIKKYLVSKILPKTFPCCFSEGIVPGPPTDLSVTEATQSYVVLSWKPPGERGHEGILYFVEKVSSGINIITSCNFLKISLKAKIKFALCPEEGDEKNETKQNRILMRYMHFRLYHSIIYDSHDMETTEMPIDG